MSLPMTYAEASSICGRQSSTALRNMVAALSIHPRLNTKADERRLKAAKVVLSARTEGTAR